MSTCSQCGVVVEDLPLTWSVENNADGRILLCEACTREHLRSIEAKLDADWF